MSPLNPLNPDAGDVPIPEDRREIDAALRAGEVTLRMFPYLVWRYGERGKLFTKSDSAWLAWLTRHDVEQVFQQVAWLRNVLSNRGMPGWILEVHLTSLYRQLLRTAPEHESRYLRLTTCAKRLRQARTEAIDAQGIDRLVSDFLVALPVPPSSLLEGVGRLLVASVADEGQGVKHAVDSLTAWLLDLPGLRGLNELQEVLSASDRRLLDSKFFQRRWDHAITATIAGARQEQR